MKKLIRLLVVVATALALLSACNNGVPKVTNPHNPLDADGKSMKGTEFLQKYCTGNHNNEDCIKVQKAVSSDSSKGELPKGW